jgi:ABC-type antimicrobial peptide transport system permease subunit
MVAALCLSNSVKLVVICFSRIIALLIALITISFQSLLVATRNPVEALRYE